jgi:protein gp37
MSKPGIETGIYWESLSLVDGCTKSSPGCLNCWLEDMGKRFHKWPDKVTPRWDRLDIPLKKKKSTVFAVWSDLFHEDVEWEFIYKAEAMMAAQERHTFLVLTKRAKSMAITLNDIDFHLERNGSSRMNNVWHGVTVCNQAEADAKIPELLKVPGHKWLSIEPMLGPINMDTLLWTCRVCGYYCDKETHPITEGDVEWVVVGAETGPHRRPCNIEWIRSIVQQCKAAGVPVWVKAVPVERDVHPRPNNKGDTTWDVVTRISHDMTEWPEDLRVREVPWKERI